MVSTCWWWLKDWERGYKCPEWVSSRGFPGPALKIQWKLRVEPLVLPIKNEPADMLRLPPDYLSLEVFRVHSSGWGVQGRPRTGLGMAWDPHGGAGGCCWAEGCLDFLTQSDATVIRSWISDGKWMEGLIPTLCSTQSMFHTIPHLALPAGYSLNTPSLPSTCFSNLFMDSCEVTA